MPSQKEIHAGANVFAPALDRKLDDDESHK